MNELGLRSGDYSTIIENEMDCKIANYLSIHRLCGGKTISGLLQSEGRLQSLAAMYLRFNLTGTPSWH